MYSVVLIKTRKSDKNIELYIEQTSILSIKQIKFIVTWSEFC